MQTFFVKQYTLHRVILLTFIIILTISACGSDPGELGIDLDGQDTVQLDAEGAQQIASTFLDAWMKGDFETMYAFISPNARDSFSQERFTQIYTEVDEVLAIETISYEINSVLVQGTTAVIDYRVEFDTQRFGTISDPQSPADMPRVMRLITTPEGWRLAWSRSDIFMGWTNSSYLDVKRTPPERGNIYDRNGEPLVVQNGVMVQIYLTRNQIPNEAECVTVLADILRKSEADVTAIISDFTPDAYFFVGEVSQDTMTQNQGRLQASCNADTAPRTTRQYYDHVAPHLIGYVGQIPAERADEYTTRGYPPNALVGLSGIEQAFENQLAGTIGLQLVLQSNTGVELRTLAERPAQPGQSVYLTIDRQLQLDVQYLLADAYSKGVNTWSTGSPGAAVVVMDVNTGEVLAMASYPDFDPGVFNPDTPVWNAADLITEYNNIDVRRPLFNRATRGRYPLGSVFKIFSMTAGLDSGVWNPQEIVTCTGKWDGTPYGADIKDDWKKDGHGDVNIGDALTGSCNPFFWELGVKLNQADPNILPNYVMKFGFGTPLSLQGIPVDAGLIPNPDWKLTEYGTDWTHADAANLVIGQGETAVNPLQVVRGVAAIANGGMLWNPMVVQKVQIIGQPPSEEYEPTGQQLDIDPAVLEQVRTAMCRVTSDPALGTAYFMFGEEWYDIIQYAIEVCGKTGTAETGGKPHAWFSAYAPADNPEIAITVIVENSCEGSEVAAPITRRIIEKYYNLDESYDWPDLWWTGCTEIGPGSGP